MEQERPGAGVCTQRGGHAGAQVRPRPVAAPPPLPPAEADVEPRARAAAGGGGAAARRRRALSGWRGPGCGGGGSEAAEGIPAARRRKRTMNGDRTESDWQGLVSEVSPRRRPGGMGRAERPPAPGPRPQRGRGGAGTRGGRAYGDPPDASFCSHFGGPRHLVPAFGEGPSAGPGLALERRPRDPGGGAKPHLPAWSPAVLEPSDWTLVPKRKGGAREENPGRG